MWRTSFRLRAWQEKALASWEESYRGVVSVVTGGGKTIFALACMQRFRESNANARFLIIVPTLSLLDQWHVSLREDLGVPEQEIACYSGDEKPNQPALVNIAVLNTARKFSQEIAAHGDVCLIVDECHRAGSPENARAMQGDFVAALGLSATPVREYDDGFDRYVKPALGSIIYEYDYIHASKDGVICPFRLTNAAVRMLPSEEREYKRLTSRAQGLRQKILRGEAGVEQLKGVLMRRARVASRARLRKPVAIKLIEKYRGRRALVFHESVQDAEEIASALARRGHRVTLYHSSLAAPLRRDNLRLFRNGLFDVLVSCRALDEGMNVPETEIAVIASATASVRQRIQRLGRVLRPAEGKELAHVFTLYASLPEEKRLRDEAGSLCEIAETEWIVAEVRQDGKTSYRN